jgi:hypothetical protein
VLSIAYQYSGANRPAIEDEYAKVREENDWTSQQVALYPERALVGSQLEISPSRVSVILLSGE